MSESIPTPAPQPTETAPTPSAPPDLPVRHLTIEQRYTQGRTFRKSVPLEAHAECEAPAGRRDPVEVLEAQSASRLPDLVPVRYSRMLASPFAFFRGSAAIMAMDLATMPRTNLHVQLCGDAHLANFGVFGSPERELLFDIDDFDETLPGPFEWDLKRLATSFVLVARANGFSGADGRATVRVVVAAYRQAMRRFAELGTLAIWYSHVTVEEIRATFDSVKARRRSERWMRKARSNDSIKAFNKLTRVVDGRRRIVDDPPLIERLPPELDHDDLVRYVHQAFHGYRQSLDADKRHLLNQFQPVDVARKVVGVGSVGTRCYIVLLEGRDLDDPLFLQIKEAQPSVLEPYLQKSPYHNNGERVVAGQRWMKAASDICLGWFRDESGRDFYWRQLEDLKASVPVQAVPPNGLMLYGRVCGRTLARAHARSGDSVQIAAYLGRSTRFDESLVRFAEAYADQTERDHSQLVAAHKGGRIQAARGR